MSLRNKLSAILQKEPVKTEKVFVKTPKQLVASLAKLRGEKNLGADTETSGFRPQSNSLWSFQLSSEDGSYAVNIPLNLWLESGIEHGKRNLQFDESLIALQQFLKDEDKTFIFHNAKFDIQFLKENGLEPTNVFCTALAEKIITAGRLQKSDLKTTLHRRFKVEMSKEVRTEFYDSTFEARHNQNPLSAWTPEIIDYALDDVIYLGRLMKQQLKDIKELMLKATLSMELDLQFPTARMETIGIGIDAAGCKLFQEEMVESRDIALKEVLAELQPIWEKVWRRQYDKDMKAWDAWKVKYDLVKAQTAKMKDGRKLSAEAVEKRKAIKDKCPFTSGQKPKEKGELKLRSAVPLKATLAEYGDGIFLPNTKKETLEQFRSESPIIEQILEYKKYAKLAEFGELYNMIDPVTGRIHASFNQVVATGRFSCSAPNLQQIPSRTAEGKRFRKLFRARPKYKFIGADFAGIELVILAVLSKEKGLLDAINRRDDPHSYTISRILNTDYDLVYQAAKKGKIKDKYKAVALREQFEKIFDLPMLTKLEWDEESMILWFQTLRDYTKTLSYGIVYGLSEYGLARKFHCSVDDARKFIQDGFLRVYPNIAKYTVETGEQGFRRGYSQTTLGRKRFFRKPKRKQQWQIADELRAQLVKEGKNLKAIDKYEWNDLLRDAENRHRREIQAQTAAIKREAGNMPIQGTSADITKLAMIYFDNAIREINYPEDEGLILTVHDELIAEISEKRAKEAKKLMDECMIDAAHYFLGEDVTIDVDAYIADEWQK